MWAKLKNGKRPLVEKVEQQTEERLNAKSLLVSCVLPC
jgi:hypothetical protein